MTIAPISCKIKLIPKMIELVKINPLRSYEKNLNVKKIANLRKY